MEKKNLALEALRKLLNDSIRSRSAPMWSRRGLLGAAGRRHCALPRQRHHHRRGAAGADQAGQGHPRGAPARRGDRAVDEEIAFYDALAENESAVQVMGDDKLWLIAHELLMSLRQNVTVDWNHRESRPRQDARAGQAHPQEVRLPARPPGCRGADWCWSRPRRSLSGGWRHDGPLPPPLESPVAFGEDHEGALWLSLFPPPSEGVAKGSKSRPDKGRASGNSLRLGGCAALIQPTSLVESWWMRCAYPPYRTSIGRVAGNFLGPTWGR
jgi:hypothetical protein